jgi:histidinol phosphatase-like PHP family hydrolase
MNDYHIHTNITDGSLSPEQIINLSKKLDVKIAITEHITRHPTYNWFELRDRIKELDKNVLVGVEAKIIAADGSLDVSDEILTEADLVLGSVHSVGTVEWLLNSKCDVIAHPQITQANLHLFKKCPKVLEINFKHSLPFDVLDELIEGNTFSFGSDTHAERDFIGAQLYFQMILTKYSNIKEWRNT